MPQQNKYNTRFSLQEIPAFSNDYIEYETRVIVRGEENTMTAFQPSYLHGTCTVHTFGYFKKVFECDLDKVY